MAYHINFISYRAWSNWTRSRTWSSSCLQPLWALGSNSGPVFGEQQKRCCNKLHCLQTVQRTTWHLTTYSKSFGQWFQSFCIDRNIIIPSTEPNVSKQSLETTESKISEISEIETVVRSRTEEQKLQNFQEYVKSGSSETLPVSEESLNAPAQCGLCMFIAQEVDYELASNKSIRLINETVYKICYDLQKEVQPLVSMLVSRF